MKKHNFLLFIACTVALAGCNPFSAKQSEVEDFIATTDAAGKNITKRYQPKIRKIKDYKVYQYKEELKDPFRAREFVAKDTPLPAPPETTNKKRCEPPSCVPPKKHPKSVLEDFSLDTLEFVGTLANDRNVGLIQTPSLGVVKVRVGEYMGKNNGRVLAIKESAIILQEKIYNSGLWKDKKTVLIIRR